LKRIFTLLFLLLACGIGVTAFAEDVTISTSVPGFHIVTVEAPGGRVIADGTVCGETVKIERQKEQTYSIEPDEGKRLVSVFYNDIDVTDQMSGSTYTAPPMIADSTLKAVFQDAPFQPGPDPAHPGTDPAQPGPADTGAAPSVTAGSAGTVPAAAASSALPRTGDDFALWIWAGLMLIACGGLIVTVLYVRKKNRDN